MIRGRKTVFSTPWLDVVAKDTDLDPQPFYSLAVADYVAIVAFTVDGDVLLVRQYRPAVEHVTLELPSGTIDKGESPRDTALRELEEETGHTAETAELLGELLTDTGKMQNRMFCYLMRDARPLKTWTAEPGITVVKMSPEALNDAVRTGAFNHALHVAALHLLSTR